MAEVLQDYLVSIRYAADAASQQRFLDQLKRVAMSVTGVAGEVAGLGVAILAMARSMASAGEQLYFASQRIGSTAADIQGMAAAMSNLGVSAEHAMSSIESFAAWTRDMGPAATAFLRTMGVTATDTTQRMDQLATALRRMSGPEGSIQYSIAKRYAQMMGIDEPTFRAMSSGQYQQQRARQGMLQQMIWGGDAQGGTKAFTEQSNVVMTQFRQMGFVFEQLRQKFGLGLFQAILPHLQKLNDLLLKMLPDINRLMNDMLHYVGPVMAFLEGAVKGLGLMVTLVANAIEMFEKLPDAFKQMIEGAAMMKVGLALATSPIMMFVAALTTLLLLLQDYQVWKTGGQAALDWSGFEKMKDAIEDFAEPIMKVKKEIDDWITKMTGLHGATDLIIGAAALLAWEGLIGKIGGVSGAVSGLITMLTGPAGLVAAFAAVAGAGIWATGKAERQLQDEVKAKFGDRYEYIPGDSGELGIYRDKQTGKTVEPDVLAKQLGHESGFVTIPEMMTGKPSGTPSDTAPSGGASNAAPSGTPLSEADKQSGWRALFGGGTDRKAAIAVNTATGAINISNADNLNINADSVDLPDAIGTQVGGSDTGGGFFGSIKRALGFGGDTGPPPGLIGEGTVRPAEGAGPLRDMIMSQLGVSKEAASAIVSNMQAESGLVSGINEKNPLIQGSRGGYGLAQWTGPRRRELEGFAAQNKMDVSKPETQVAFMKQELDKSFPHWREKMGSSNDPNELAKIWFHMYESGGDPSLERHLAGHQRAAAGISALPVGAPLTSAPSAVAAASGGTGRGAGGVTQSTTNTFNINGAVNPQATAAAVGEKLDRTNEKNARMAEGALR